MSILYLINGSSSLLFLISTVKAFYSSTLITYKLSNFFLVIASFLCNASGFQDFFLFIDYIAIFLVGISYINNLYMSLLLGPLFVYEYHNYDSILYTKNLVFIIALIKANIYSYLYFGNIYFYKIFASSIFAILIYIIRYIYLMNNINTYLLPLTWLFHISITSILYFASITAI
jgi:hypothetical protein